MTHVIYWCVFLHTLILIYGGYYTYAETPLGNWARDAFELSRNHYDRVGHVALGFFPALIIRKVLLRQRQLALLHRRQHLARHWHLLGARRVVNNTHCGIGRWPIFPRLPG